MIFNLTKGDGIIKSKSVKSKGTTVRVELQDLYSKSKYERKGKKLIIEDQFNHHSSKRFEIRPNDLGFIEFGKPSSEAVSNILSNGNIRFGMCNIGDTNRYEIVPARGAKLVLKIAKKIGYVDYVVFYNFPREDKFELLY